MKKETKEGIIAFFIIMIIGAAIYAYVRPEIPKSERLIYLFIILLPTLYVARGYYLIFSDKLSSFMRMFGFTLIFIGVIFLCTFIDIKINLKKFSVKFVWWVFGTNCFYEGWKSRKNRLFPVQEEKMEKK